MTLLAFLLAALAGGGNPVAVRISNVELFPFWGATLRMILAGLLFWLILWIRRIPLPQRRDTIFLLLTGFFSLGVSFGLLYWGLVEVQASLGSVIIALGPLLTFFFAVLHRLEVFSWRSLLGGIVALVGIAIAARAQLGGEIPFWSIAALIAGSAIGSEGNVMLKIFSPKSDPVATNALSITAGLVFLLLCVFIVGEPRNLPVLPATWMAIGYLVIPGTLLMFYLYIWVLTRWSASATSYIIMLFPIVATIASAVLTGETITPTFLLGGALVLVGVWIGALMPSATR